MHRSMALLGAAAFVALAFAGCAADDPSSSSTSKAPEASSGPPSFDTLDYDVQAAVTWWEQFVTAYAPRPAFTPLDDLAANAIAAELEAASIQVTRLAYPAGLLVTTLPEGTPNLAHVIVGTIPGQTQPELAIAIGGHYDTAVAGPSPSNILAGSPSLFSLQAAYDNGSGTAAVMSLCKQLAKAKLDKTVLCLFFDGEEAGVVGSTGYVDAKAWEPLTLEAYLGFDMVGINWPGVDPTTAQWQDWKLYTWMGAQYAETLMPLVNRTVFETLAYPRTGAEVFPFNDRNSDEAVFADAGIVTLRFAGGRTAATYPQYHSILDTVDYVDGFVGGREHFEAGFEAVVKEAYTLAVELDGTDMATIKAAS